MMVLSDTEICKRLGSRSIVIEPTPCDDNIQPASIDLHLSNDVMRISSEQRIINPMKDVWYIKNHLDSEDPRGFSLMPLQFVLSSTKEYVEVPNDLSARVEGKSTFGRLGLIIHATAGFIDPGFCGNITLELMNCNSVPLLLVPGMKIAQICFTPMLGTVCRPYGSDGLGSKYQHSEGAIGPKPIV